LKIEGDYRREYPYS